MLKKTKGVFLALACFTLICFTFVDVKVDINGKKRTIQLSILSNYELKSGLVEELNQSEQLQQLPTSATQKHDSEAAIDATKKITTATAAANETRTLENLEPCPIAPKRLVGPLKVIQENITWEQVEENNKGVVSRGGRAKPLDCIARHKVALIIPYRNREAQLQMFTNYMHPILSRQELDYGIYVVNQADELEFNRAALFNVGFKEALKEYDWDCFIFHDVDLLPEDDRNLYTCPEKPRHMSVAVDTLKYRLPYATIFGGVVAMTKEQFQKSNGFSNQFWGWGGEDDDMYNRVKNAGYKITRYSADIARYTMIKHKKATPSEARVKVLSNGKRYFRTDGLNNLRYKVIKKSHENMYTNITVHLEEVAPTNKVRKNNTEASTHLPLKPLH